MMRPRNWRVRGCSGEVKILSGGPCFEDPASVEEADAVCDIAGETHLVGGYEHGHAFAGELFDDGEDLGD